MTAYNPARIYLYECADRHADRDQRGQQMTTPSATGERVVVGMDPTSGRSPSR
jgi:hypothetical protein